MLADRLIGNRSRLPLVPLISLRSQVLFRRLPTALTVLALAMSIALAASVEMASRSVRTAVNRTADALVGGADLEVTAGGVGIDEGFIDTIRSVRGVAHASPSIHQTFRIAEGPGTGEAIRMIGIDFLEARDVHRFSVVEGGVVISDPLRLVAQSNSILISSAMADRLGLSEGSVIVLRGPVKTDRFVVRGLLAGELTEAFGGQIAVMDIYGLQAQLRLGRRVHRIDVVFESGANVAAVQSQIAGMVGAGIAVRPPALRQELRHSTMGVIDISIWSLVVIATLLALLSTYAVISLSVDRRLEELALLRVAGMEGRRIAGLIITDAVLIALVSTVIGLGIARFVADPLVALLSEASQNLQRLRIDPLGFEPRTGAVALLVGVPVALFASLEPALRVSRGSPIEVLAGQRYAEHRSNVSLQLLVLSVVSASISATAWYFGAPIPAGVRLGVIFGFSVLALGLGSGQLFAVSLPRLRVAFGTAIPRIGHLVASLLMERTLETGMTVAVWAGLVGGVVAMTTTIESITASMDAYYSGWTGPTAYVAFGEDPLAKSATDREHLREESIAAIRSTPGVVDTVPFHDVIVNSGGDQLRVWGVDSATLAARGGFDGVFSDRNATVDALRRGEGAVARSFAERRGVTAGDEVVLETNSGLRSIRVGALVQGFSTTTGTITVDESVMREWFGPGSGASFVAFWIEGDRDSVLARVQSNLKDQALFILDASAYRTLTRRTVDRYRALLLLPVVLLGSAGTVVLLNLLVGNVLARRNDFAILRCAGGSVANVVGIVIATGAVIGLVGTGIGVPLAAYWNLAITRAIFEAFGWLVQFQFSWSPAIIAIILACFASVFAAIVPAALGRKQVPVGSVLGSH